MHHDNVFCNNYVRREKATHLLKKSAAKMLKNITYHRV